MISVFVGAIDILVDEHGMLDWLVKYFPPADNNHTEQLKMFIAALGIPYSIFKTQV